TATTPIYSLPLHDALPISVVIRHRATVVFAPEVRVSQPCDGIISGVGIDTIFASTSKEALEIVGSRIVIVVTEGGIGQCIVGIRSEEHTSELQSRENLVCR